MLLFCRSKTELLYYFLFVSTFLINCRTANSIFPSPVIINDLPKHHKHLSPQNVPTTYEDDDVRLSPRLSAEDPNSETEESKTKSDSSSKLGWLKKARHTNSSSTANASSMSTTEDYQAEPTSGPPALPHYESWLFAFIIFSVVILLICTVVFFWPKDPGDEEEEEVFFFHNLTTKGSHQRQRASSNSLTEEQSEEQSASNGSR